MDYYMSSPVVSDRMGVKGAIKFSDNTRVYYLDYST